MRPSVCPSWTTIPLELFKDLLYYARIWRIHIQFYEASRWRSCSFTSHYNDVIMSAMASQITSLMVVYLTFYSGADQRKHQSSASLAFVRGIHRWPANSPHKGPVTRKMIQFDDVITSCAYHGTLPWWTWTRSYGRCCRADCLRISYTSLKFDDFSTMANWGQFSLNPWLSNLPW